MENIPWFDERPVSEVRPGDHGLLGYVDAEERDRVVGPFVRAGLATEEKVVYITDQPAESLPGLERCSLDLARLKSSRQLRLLSRREACLSRAGAFEPAKLADTLDRERESAFGEGYRAVRVTMDSTWLLTEPGGAEAMLSCEDRVDRAISPSTMAMGVCQVDVRRCGTAQFGALRDSHEVLMRVDAEFDDGILTIRRIYGPFGLKLRGELDASRHSHVSEHLLRAMASRRGDIHLDVAELDFIDIGGLNLLAQHAAELPRGGALYLDHLRPDVENVITMVGWNRLPRLRPGARTGGAAR
ncbi:STAS domain-containing protein [Actinomadura logoneensis]|uniref:STAS domain-containing protein n=1 Tax=Actinomadura logoneensis TaxID=2293572 RepID=A0A372J988_9ACTN|nr:MEDS domain-containing protein [Actinomadura logoneensis]RFU36553.1 STAS domain-containing protein [Actinomadura logoneensis]